MSSRDTASGRRSWSMAPRARTHTRAHGTADGREVVREGRAARVKNVRQKCKSWRLRYGRGVRACVAEADLPSNPAKACSASSVACSSVLPSAADGLLPPGRLLAQAAADGGSNNLSHQAAGGGRGEAAGVAGVAGGCAAVALVRRLAATGLGIPPHARPRCNSASEASSCSANQSSRLLDIHRQASTAKCKFSTLLRTQLRLRELRVQHPQAAAREAAAGKAEVWAASLCEQKGAHRHRRELRLHRAGRWRVTGLRRERGASDVAASSEKSVRCYKAVQKASSLQPPPVRRVGILRLRLACALLQLPHQRVVPSVRHL